MNSIRLARAGSILLLIGAIGLCCLHVDAVPQTQTLGQFYQTLVEGYSASTVPTDAEVMAVTGQIKTTSREDITQALPWIIQAAAHQDDRIKLDAVAALIAIAVRSDSAELLKNYTGAIANLLDSPNPRLQSGAAGILGYLRPAVPADAVPLLLAFVKRTDRDPLAQASSLSVLLKKAPEDREVVAATEDFLSRPLDLQTKEAVLNGIANSHTKDPRLVQILIAALDDPNEGVRFTAAQAFWRMGKEAALQAQPALLKVVARPDESSEVKAAARKALELASRGAGSPH